MVGGVALRIFIASALHSLILIPCNGLIFKNVNLGIRLNTGAKKEEAECTTKEISCFCGNTRSTIAVPVQCSYFHRWKARCDPCDKIKPEDVCPKFQNCAACSLNGGDRCELCPKLKFGTWCENVCSCQNGADCDRSGRCICLEGFEGTECERKKGCPPPAPVSEPLKGDYRPPENPTTIIYSCPPNFELKGSAISTCLSGGQWSSPPPHCLIKCPLLSAPANGRLTYAGSELVVGVTAEVTCNENHRLIGESTLVCLPGGVWNSELPRCNQLASCADPGFVQHAERTVSLGSSRYGGVFLQDTKIHYTCRPDFQQMGANTLLCLFDGTWSAEPPTCVKVSKLIPNCNTVGSDVVDDEGVPVRILCPPECANREARIWGTSIYRMESAVCPAAVHSGKITNSGGLVAVINNGQYSQFAASNLNNVQSQSFDGRDRSFRFDKLSPFVQGREYEDCPTGLDKLDKACVYITMVPRIKDEAEVICTNLGLRLSLPKSSEELKRLLLIMTSKGIDKVWTEETYSGETSAEELDIDVDNKTHVNMVLPTERKCGSAVVANLEITRQFADCDQPLHYVCIESSTTSLLASCEDLGPLANGEAKAVGQINNAFYVGSSMEFTCASLHYLKGSSVISCTGNGTWSEDKPTCVKVNTCEEPPVPRGGFVNYLPPLQTQGSQRTAMTRAGMAEIRMARLPVGLGAQLPPEGRNAPTPTPEPESIKLPPGQHRVGTRAMYDCESRYYRLVGSRTRRCQGQGEWSGRPPTCIPVCGRSDSPRTPFIVNGNASDIGQWPWQAGLARYLPDYNTWFLLCGGSLLTESWVITAAHCVTYAGTTLTIDPDKFRVYLGKYHRTDSKDDDFVQIKTIREIHIHPDYDPGLFDADIALLQLDSNVQLNSRVQPVCLPTEQTSRQNLEDGKKGVVTGWGMNENETYSDTLQQAVLPVVSHERCERGYLDSELPLTVTENMYCAGFAQGRTDACSGDSGGPMVFADDSAKERRWVLEGIVSWGSPKGCGNPNQYGGFTTVSKFLDWINLFF